MSSHIDVSPFLSMPDVFPAPEFVSSVPGVKSAFLKGPDYRGHETRIFIWYGIPENATPEKPVPGIILVHGGIGTAFAPWVKKWNDRGFAAVAMDQFCAIPQNDGSYCSMNPPKRHTFSGPSSEEKYDHLDDPLTDQWPYHAIASVMLANTFLRNLPEVNADKIGITGISWGGYTTALVIGYDPRFAYAMPVYGCGGFDTQTITTLVPPQKREKFYKLWDPNHTLSRVSIPVLWTVGTNDFAFDVWNWNHSSSLNRNTYRSLKTNFPHSQYDGESPLELEVFAKAVTEGKPYSHFDMKGNTYDGNTFSCKFFSQENISSAELFATRAEGHWSDRYFRSFSANYDEQSGIVSSVLPKGQMAAFLSVTGMSGCIYTSEVLIV